MSLGDVRHLRALMGAAQGFALVHVVRTGLETGLLAALAQSQSESDLAGELSLARDLVGAWLRVAEAHRLVRSDAERWSLAPFGRWLIESGDAPALRAMVEQVVLGWGAQFETLPRLLKGAERRAFGTAEEAARVAAASRLVEPRAIRALGRIPGARHVHRVLDVGCGHGSYLVAWLTQHRDAVGLGIELDPAVAEEARRTLREAQVSRRAEVRVGDFLTMDLPAGSWELAMLNNDVYYFPPADLPALFRRLRSRLVPGGVLALQTPVHTRGPLARWLGLAASSATFDLFLRTFRNLYGLPDLPQLHQMLRDTGFGETGEVSIMPGGGQRYVWARVPAES